MQEQLQQLMETQARLLDSIRHLSAKLVEVAETAMEVGQQINRLSTLGDDSKTEPTSAAPRASGHFHEVGSCYCDRWPSDERLREFIAERGGAVSVIDCMVAFGIATHAQTIAMIGEAVGRRAIESTTDEMGLVWYQRFVADSNPPDSESEMPCPRNPLCVLGPFHNGECEDARQCAENIREASTPASEVRPVASVELGAEQSGPPAIESAPSPPSGVRKKNEFTAREWANGPHFLAFMKQKEFAAWDVTEQNRRRDEFVAATSPELRMNRWGSRFKSFHGVS